MAIDGNPEYKLRYKYGKNYEYKGFSYESEHRNWKFIDSEKENGIPMTNLTIGTETIPVVDPNVPEHILFVKGHDVFFYDAYVTNNTGTRKNGSIKLYRKTDKMIQLKIANNIVLDITLNEDEKMVQYPNDVYIYDKYNKKIRSMRLITNGIIFDDNVNNEKELFVFDENGDTIVHNTYMDFYKPTRIYSDYILPLVNRPMLMVADGDGTTKEIYFTYDTYGLMESCSDDSCVVDFKKYIIKDSTIFQSIHPVFFDNFDNEYYYNGKMDRYVIERIVQYGNGDIEYTRECISGIQDINTSGLLQ